tara:strand:+ start:197 stop:631 length:435 start_codon:yes stop_codon:yes gene_type:complete
MYVLSPMGAMYLGCPIVQPLAGFLGGIPKLYLYYTTIISYKQPATICRIDRFPPIWQAAWVEQPVPTPKGDFEMTFQEIEYWFSVVESSSSCDVKFHGEEYDLICRELDKMDAFTEKQYRHYMGERQIYRSLVGLYDETPKVFY